MAVDKKGFSIVKFDFVKIPKATTTDGKCEITIKIEAMVHDAEQLANFAHRQAHLKMTLTEFDPELPLPKD